CCKVQSDLLLDKLSNNDYVARARLLAARSPGSGDWLEALPLSSVGLKMDNATAVSPSVCDSVRLSSVSTSVCTELPSKSTDTTACLVATVRVGIRVTIRSTT